MSICYHEQMHNWQCIHHDKCIYGGFQRKCSCKNSTTNTVCYCYGSSSSENNKYGIQKKTYHICSGDNTWLAHAHQGIPVGTLLMNLQGLLDDVIFHRVHRNTSNYRDGGASKSLLFEGTNNNGGSCGNGNNGIKSVLLLLIIIFSFCINNAGGGKIMIANFCFRYILIHIIGLRECGCIINRRRLNRLPQAQLVRRIRVIIKFTQSLSIYVQCTWLSRIECFDLIA